MSKKKTCAYCGQRSNAEDMFVKHAGKHNTYYCNEREFNLAMERKQKREANQKAKVNSNEAS